MLEEAALLANQKISFEVTGGAIHIRGNSDFSTYPAPDGRRKAIGAHTVWTSAIVTIRLGAEPQYQNQAIDSKSATQALTNTQDTIVFNTDVTTLE